MKGDVSFHLLHGLVDVAVQNGYGTESLQIRKGLLAIVGTPAPLWIHGPQGNVREHDNRGAALELGNVLLEPGKLLGSEVAQATGLEVHYVYQADEMRAFLIEAVPAIAHRVPAEALPKYLAVVVQDVVLAWNVEHLIRIETLE